MGLLRFTTSEPSTDRRHKERRHFWAAGEGVATPEQRALKRVFMAGLVLVLGAMMWKWRTVIYGPMWLIRAHAADRGDIYIGRTNGVSNRELTMRARAYLTDVNQLDASGNITPVELRAMGEHIDLSWFKTHHPETVTFNPFMAPKGSFIVSWLYVPGCQKSMRGVAKPGTQWFDKEGRPCGPICNLSVMMAPDFRLTAVKVDPAS